jgi:hypothetical protein
MSEPLHEIIGPYERWAYGAGRPYLFGPSQPSSPQYIAAMAVLPADRDLTSGAARAAMTTGGAPRSAEVLVPAMWSGASPVDGVRFWPLLLQLDEPVPREPARSLTRIADALRSVAAGLGASVYALAAGAGGQAIGDALSTTGEEAGFSLNMPLPGHTVDAGHDRDRIGALYGKVPKRSQAPQAIVAVIDDGIPFAHRNLRMAEGRSSRVEFCWLQSGRLAAARERRSVLFGRELLRDETDRLIGDFGHDEDRLYAESGARESAGYPGLTIDRQGSHGSHVLDLAAGFRPGAAPDGGPAGPNGTLDRVAVIAVQLPAPTTLDTTAFGKDAFILSAFHYIFDRADRIRDKYGLETLPLIVNFSYGFSGGPHGGRERLERALKALVEARSAYQPTHLVMPSGNTFQSALYGEISAAMLAARGEAGADAFTIPWRIQPSDHTANYLEIWLPDGASPQDLSVTIAAPSAGGALLTMPSLNPPAGGVEHTDITVNGRVIGQLSVERYATGGGNSLWRLVVLFAPTQPDDPSLPAAPAGLFEIRLGNLAAVLAKGPVKCRIQRDNDPFGYTRGARQSYFDDPLDIRLRGDGRLPEDENPAGAFVRRFGTLNGLATHDVVSVIGGFIGTTGEPSGYSSAGSLPGGAGQAGSVSFSAPSDTSRMLGGIVAAGTRSGALFRMSGTSVAAPRIARALAVGYLERAAAGDASSGAAEAVLAPRLEPRPPPGPAARARLGRRLKRLPDAPAGPAGSGLLA